MPRHLSLVARQKAIDAAQAVVAELGISGFTLDGVAKRSGVAKTTLYRHWKSGSALLIHAIDCGIERAPTPNTGTLRGDLTEILTTVVEVFTTESNRQMMLEMASAAAKDPEFAALKQAMVQERTKPIRDVLRRAIDRGEIEPIDLRLASCFVEGPVLARIMDSNETIGPDDIRAMVDLMVRGLGADPGQLRAVWSDIRDMRRASPVHDPDDAARQPRLPGLG